MEAIYIFVNDPIGNAGTDRIGRIGLVRGPYSTPDAARMDYEETISYVDKNYPWAAFWGRGIGAFNTAMPGKLNTIFSA